MERLVASLLVFTLIVHVSSLAIKSVRDELELEQKKVERKLENDVSQLRDIDELRKSYDMLLNNVVAGYRYDHPYGDDRLGLMGDAKYRDHPFNFGFTRKNKYGDHGDDRFGLTGDAKYRNHPFNFGFARKKYSDHSDDRFGLWGDAKYRDHPFNFGIMRKNKYGDHGDDRFGITEDAKHRHHPFNFGITRKNNYGDPGDDRFGIMGDAKNRDHPFNFGFTRKNKYGDHPFSFGASRPHGGKKKDWNTHWNTKAFGRKRNMGVEVSPVDDEQSTFPPHGKRDDDLVSEWLNDVIIQGSTKE